MNFDTEVLNQRLKETRQEVSFYGTAIEMLVKKYQVHRLIQEHSLEDKLKDLTEEVRYNLLNGEVPTIEDLNMNPISVLDDFIQEMMYVIGSIIGILQLKRFIDENDDDTEYMDFIMMTQSTPEFCIQASGFSAWTLMTGRVPSGIMLERMFPISEERETNQTSIDLVVELNGDSVFKYMKERKHYYRQAHESKTEN